MAVFGSIKDPLAAPGPYENLGPPFLGGSAQPVTFVLPLTHTQLPLINGHSSRICSEAGLMYLFGDKYIRPVPEQILLQCPLRSGSSVCMCEGQNKSDRLSTATQKWGSQVLIRSWSSQRIFNRPINGREISSSVFGLTRRTRL